MHNVSGMEVYMEQERRDEYSYYEAQPIDHSYVNVEVKDREGIMTKTFLYMFAVLLVSALSAYIVADSGLFYGIFTNKGLLIGFLVAELVAVFAAQWTMSKDMVIPSAVLLFVYSVVNGATLSYVFKLYASATVVSVFLITAIVFVAMALVGLVTKKDLSVIGQIGLMALIGLIVLTVVNIFMGNSQLDMIISAIGLTIFIGLTAYDTQKVKQMAEVRTDLSSNTVAMFGALQLYLDFINMFLYILRLFGSRD